MSAPYNGDNKLYGKETRAYYSYGWGEIKANQEPAGVLPTPAYRLRPQDDRSPYRVYADTLMEDTIARYLPQPAQIVDIGCGPGLYAKLFKTHEGVYHGVDIVDYPAWQETQQIAQQENWALEVRFYPLPGEQLGTLDICANFSLSSSSLEHVNDPGEVIRGLAKISQPGAIGLHIVPAPWSLLSYGKHGWRRFSAMQLKQLFEEAGFECLQIYRLGGIPTTLLFFLWGMGLEQGLALQSATLGKLPYIIYRLNSLFSFPNARTNPITGFFYRPLLKAALWLDRFLPKMAVGYAILVRRK